MQTKENKMGVMPIKKLLINMSLPIMISMLVQALYNIVDSIFVAQVSEHALTAVSLAYPVQKPYDCHCCRYCVLELTLFFLELLEKRILKRPIVQLIMVSC